MQAINRLSGPQREALAREDAPFLAAGLMAFNPRSFEAHLRHAAGLLRDRQTSASLCTRLVRHVTDLFERSVPAPDRARLACANGCSFCCHQPVLVGAAEAFFLATKVRERPDLAVAVREAVALLSGRRADGPKGPWLRCSLLNPAGSCSVHAVRPLACHAYVSLNVQDCKDSLQPPFDGVVREPPSYPDLKNACRMILQASLRLNGLPDTNYELNAALGTVLDTENAEKRWLRGEDIFAGIAKVMPNTPDVERILAQMVVQIAPTL